MDNYRSDDEQAEALKRWWLENGRAVVMGIVIGLAVVVGVRYWYQHQKDMSHNASQLYARIEQALAKKDPETVLVTGQLLIKDYGRTTYAVMAAMTMAKVEVDAGRNDRAKDHLQWVVDHAEGGMQDTARIRLARLLLNDNKLQEASNLLKGIKSIAYAADYNELHADIELAKGNKTQARELYQLALNGSTGLLRDFLQMKIDNIAVDSKPTETK